MARKIIKYLLVLILCTSIHACLSAKEELDPQSEGVFRIVADDMGTGDDGSGDDGSGDDGSGDDGSGDDGSGDDGSGDDGSGDDGSGDDGSGDDGSGDDGSGDDGSGDDGSGDDGSGDDGSGDDGSGDDGSGDDGSGDDGSGDDGSGDDGSGDDGSGDDGSGDDGSGDDGAGGECHNEAFSQPKAEISNTVDILFVTDTSGSLNVERQEIANEIDSFVSQLEDHVDYRIAVMLAHAETQYAGTLYQAGDEPVVIDSTQHSIEEVRSFLLAKQTTPPGEGLTDGGEAGAYSLQKSLSSESVAAIRAQGFYRENAALAAVFVSDENDLCTLGEVVDGQNKEIPFYNNYCGETTPQIVVDQLHALQAGQPLLVGGIVYTDPTTVPAGGENEIGLGFLDSIAYGNGLAVDLAGDISDGLADIGNLTTTILNLLTEFDLANDNVDPESIEVFIDGEPVEFTYNDQTNQVVLTGYAGEAESSVTINYCTTE